ncbi:MAG: hypothetical protein ABTQ73_14205 [Caldilineales bacterium]
MTAPLTFGMLLRRYRKQTLDPRTQGPLSQERLAEELHQTKATISLWKNDQRRINVDDRAMLLLLLEVLSRRGGVHGLASAAALLWQIKRRRDAKRNKAELEE